MQQAPARLVWLEKYTNLHQYWHRRLVETPPANGIPHAYFNLERASIDPKVLGRLRVFLQEFTNKPWYKRWFASNKEYFAIPHVEEFLFWHPVVTLLQRLPETISRTDQNYIRMISQCAAELKTGAQKYFQLYEEAGRVATELENALNQIEQNGSCSYRDNLSPPTARNDRTASTAWQNFIRWVSSLRSQNRTDALNQPLLSQPSINHAGAGLNAEATEQPAPAAKPLSAAEIAARRAEATRRKEAARRLILGRDQPPAVAPPAINPVKIAAASSQTAAFTKLTPAQAQSAGANAAQAAYAPPAFKPAAPARPVPAPAPAPAKSAAPQAQAPTSTKPAPAAAPAPKAQQAQPVSAAARPAPAPIPEPVRPAPAPTPASVRPVVTQAAKAAAAPAPVPAAQAKAAPAAASRTQQAPTAAAAPNSGPPIPWSPDYKLSQAYTTLGFNYLEADYLNVRRKFVKLIKVFHPDNSQGLAELTQEDERRKDAISTAVQTIKETMDAAELLGLTFETLNTKAALAAYQAKAAHFFPGKTITPEMSLDEKLSPYANAYHTIKSALKPVEVSAAAAPTATAAAKPPARGPSAPVKTSPEEAANQQNLAEQREQEELLPPTILACRTILGLDVVLSPLSFDKEVKRAYDAKRVTLTNKSEKEKEIACLAFYLLMHVNKPTSKVSSLLIWAKRLKTIAPELIEAQTKALQKDAAERGKEVKPKEKVRTAAGGAGAPAPTR